MYSYDKKDHSPEIAERHRELNDRLRRCWCDWTGIDNHVSQGENHPKACLDLQSGNTTRGSLHVTPCETNHVSHSLPHGEEAPVFYAPRAPPVAVRATHGVTCPWEIDPGEDGP